MIAFDLDGDARRPLSKKAILDGGRFKTVPITGMHMERSKFPGADVEVIVAPPPKIPARTLGVRPSKGTVDSVGEGVSRIQPQSAADSSTREVSYFVLIHAIRV